MRQVKLLVSLVAAALLLAAGATFLGGCGVEAAALSSGSEPSATQTPATQPPAWLLARIGQETRNLGDPHALAWWAVTADGTIDSTPVANGGRLVYVTLVTGAFTNWLWSLPAGASPPPFRWVTETIDATSRIVNDVGVTKDRPGTSGLQLNAVDVVASATDVVETPAAGDVPPWLLEQAQRQATNCGDPHPELAEWVASHKNDVELVLTGDQCFEPDMNVIVLALKGHFTDTKSYAPPGAPDPTGTWLMAMFNAHDHGCVGFGLGDQPLQLSKLGIVHGFTL